MLSPTYLRHWRGRNAGITFPAFLSAGLHSSWGVPALATGVALAGPHLRYCDCGRILYDSDRVDLLCITASRLGIPRNLCIDRRVYLGVRDHPCHGRCDPVVSSLLDRRLDQAGHCFGLDWYCLRDVAGDALGASASEYCTVGA